MCSSEINVGNVDNINILVFIQKLLFSLLSSGSWAQITLTQTPNEISATPGQTVTVSCKCSSSVGTNVLHWYQQKSGQRPTLIIRSTNNLQSGVPARFSGSGSGTDYTLKISDIKDEDEAVYYCQQYQSYPITQ
ncbi:hypothetical protein AB205_0172880 [Aquarana catesbeiana]|uniref:Ig-like domain-containing protein n=1 Tax=Aquarana catesbeiana TaxID=8400 RepID=A0A2G9QJ26_AQUCT|nr:hypothetical protein AB205_0172880 [Aquarana catesbeiana]